MLEIDVPASEFFDEDKEEFVQTKPVHLSLEHSLISLSKWESKYKKPFISNSEMTPDEVLDYIRFMTITRNVDPLVFQALPEEALDKIKDYISDSMTATTFADESHGGNRERITSEIIYYWMLSLNIPVEFERWHLSRLLTLIRVCEVKSSKSKKIPKAEVANKYKELNAARKKKYNTKG